MKRAVFIFVGLMLGPGSASSGNTIALYPGAEAYPLGDASWINGQKAEMYYFITPDSPETVAAFYREKWEAAGLIVTLRRGESDTVSLGSVDLRSGQTLSVLLMREGEHTIGFPTAIAGASVGALLSPGGVADIPVPVSAQGLTSYMSRDGGSAFRTLSFVVPTAVQANETFFLRELGSRGYRLTERQESKEEGQVLMLEFTRDARRLSITLSSVPREARTAVLVIANFGSPQTGEKQP